MRKTILSIQKMKQQGEPIPMVTVYDYTSAQIADRSGIPLMLVGDSLGMVVAGHGSTIPVTLDEMIYHTKAVVRGSEQAMVIGDMPFLTYTNEMQAIQTAQRFLQEAGAQAVKLEGGTAVAPIVRRLVDLGIPVMGHIGFTPQSVHQIGMRVQGKHTEDAKRVLEDAFALEHAGVFGLVLELVPAPLAREVTAQVHMPTIGIGAGPWCDGQVQVWHDLLGLYTDFTPRHARRYASLAETIQDALQHYANDVRAHAFPTTEHSATMDEEELREALKDIEGHASS
jgi:3-methyl-2-oxobutanoate hydroxymethyltransferase